MHPSVPVKSIKELIALAKAKPGQLNYSTSGMGATDHLATELNQEIVRVLNLPDVKEKFLKAGVEVVASSPEQFAATIKSEIAKIGKVIKDAGVKTN